MGKPDAEPRQRYLERWGSTVVMNTYLKVALFASSVALIGMLGLTFVIFSWAKNQKPLVVRIDEVGRATAVNYASFAYSPEAPELRYFLAQFVQLHYSRILGSVEERFSKSLFFVDAKLSQSVIEEERKTQSLAKFVREGSEEVDIEIKNISLQDLRSNPKRATVDFEKVIYARGERRELRRVRFAGYFEFVIQESVPNNVVLVNPLGITLTYFRADEAFKP
jgi:type IV secretory pathway TrbF-like protein